MTISRPRATGLYAVFEGREYHATGRAASVILRSYRGEPLPAEFTPSRIPSVQGIRTVQRSELEKLSFVRTVCTWNGEPFVVVGADNQVLQVFYTGTRGEWMSHQSGMVRTGKLEVCGRLAIADVRDIFEFVNPLPESL